MRSRDGAPIDDEVAAHLAEACQHLEAASSAVGVSWALATPGKTRETLGTLRDDLDGIIGNLESVVDFRTKPQPIGRIGQSPLS